MHKEFAFYGVIGIFCCISVMSKLDVNDLPNGGQLVLPALKPSNTNQTTWIYSQTDLKNTITWTDGRTSCVDLTFSMYFNFNDKEAYLAIKNGTFCAGGLFESSFYSFPFFKFTSVLNSDSTLKFNLTTTASAGGSTATDALVVWGDGMSITATTSADAIIIREGNDMTLNVDIETFFPPNEALMSGLD